MTKDSLMASLQDAAERGDGGRWEKWSAAFRECLPLKWESLKADPLHSLLNHSDCEGEIASNECGPLADRLEQLLPMLPTSVDAGHIGDWQETTKQFIAGLRLAASRGEDVDFH